MKDATHFIEVWYDDYDGQVANENMKPIEDLKVTLNRTVLYNFKTIAIWYIKPKVTMIHGESINNQTILIAESK